MDGYETLVTIEKEKQFLEICKKWEELTGYILEHDKYEFIYLWSVNDYIAKTIDGKWKYKGDAMSTFELYKNKSHRIIPLAIQEYYKNKTNPIDFITNHDNIFDFCIRAKASGQLYLEEVIYNKKDIIVTDKMIFDEGWEIYMNDYYVNKEWYELDDLDLSKACLSKEEVISRIKSKMSLGNTTRRYDKLLRYYISNTGNVLLKKGFNSKGKPFQGFINAPISELDDKQPLITQFNTYVKKDMKDYDVDYSFYIFKTLKMIDRLEKTKMLKSYVESIRSHKQLSLF